MGCNQVKEKNPNQNTNPNPNQILEQNLPILILTFDGGNKEQMEFLMAFKSEFHPKNSLKFQISSNQQSKFSIKFQRPNEQPIDILTNYDTSGEAKNQALNKLYELVDGQQANNNMNNQEPQQYNTMNNQEPQQYNTMNNQEPQQYNTMNNQELQQYNTMNNQEPQPQY